MKLFTKVKPSAKEDKIKFIERNKIFISVKAPPKQGKANEAVRKLLSKYFKVPQSLIIIISGKNSKNKIISIK